uniref:Uncharacterized protein n=1 Tax=Anguilla anguilla TaxID=7936 RepID=A0A0E9PYE4_ANGAN
MNWKSAKKWEGSYSKCFPTNPSFPLL